MIPMLQAALNGARTGDEHPGIPRTPEELARPGRGGETGGDRKTELRRGHALAKDPFD